MIQVGATLTLVQNVQESLVSAVIILSLVAIFLTGLGTWLITSRALKPLSTVTRVATQITRADDLSRRIPLRAGRNDEVGTLIRSFNATLERLETLFNSQRRFLADVSHELRTPLTVIKGNVGLMRRIGQADEESLSGIETEVDRLTRMVGDLLLLAQAEQGQLPLDMQMVELDTVLLEVFQQMRVLGGERVKVNLSEIDQIHVLGDRDRLKQVMVNLAANAVQYTPNGGTVTMGLGSINQQARIIISDTGRGIPPEDLEHIFERFYRGEKSRTRSKDSGFGLGLSIAYWIVRAHNGHIEVASQEGSGTTFTVWLPLNAPEESPLLPPVTDEKKDPS
jgi:signal transduction histidine kinase